MTVAINDVDFTTHDIEVLCDAALQVSKIKSDELGRWSLNEAFSKSLLQQEVELILESGSSTEATQLCHKLLDALRLQRFNPNHGEGGRFAEGSSTSAIQGRPIRGGRKDGVSSEARSRIRAQSEKLAAEHPIAHQVINYRIASGQMPSKTFGPSGTTTYAWCQSKSNGTSEIRMNPYYLTQSGSSADANGRMDELTGFHPTGTGNIEGIVTHETGHAYANYAIGFGEVPQRDWLAQQGVSIEDVSAYAHVNCREFIAESYASYKMAPGNSIADRVGMALDRAVSSVEAGGPGFRRI